VGYKTKMQLIRRTKGKDQWYINFPMACAQMMDFQKGETVEWELTESGGLLLKRNVESNKEIIK